MSRFKNFINEIEQIGNVMIFRATALKGGVSGKKMTCFYKMQDGTYAKYEGFRGGKHNAFTKQGMTKKECDEQIKVFVDTVGDRYKIERMGELFESWDKPETMVFIDCTREKAAKIMEKYFGCHPSNETKLVTNFEINDKTVAAWRTNPYSGLFIEPKDYFNITGKGFSVETFRRIEKEYDVVVRWPASSKLIK